MKNAYCAIDLGATSGRVIISADGAAMEEIHRFPNQVYERNGQFFWDTDFLLNEVRHGLRLLAARKDLHLCSIGVDAWGVDVVFIDKDGRALAHPRAYRDPYTDGIQPGFFQQISPDRVYEKTGIQFLDFNTLFQFYACSKEHYQPFGQADKYLFIPDYINYELTGVMRCEYTILSTSQLLNARDRKPDAELVGLCGAKMSCFAPVIMPGEQVGLLKPSVADFGYPVPVVAVASHDTASAVASVPRTVEGRHAAYLSSGTWSLMGIVVDEPVITPLSAELNFTNEGGVNGTIRLLKNITGMWILEQCRKQWKAQGKDYSYPELASMAQSVTSVPDLFNPDEPRFANPADMTAQVRDGRDMTDAETVSCIYHSLAHRYGEVFAMLRRIAPWDIDVLYVIGGGVRNSYLNRLTEEEVGVPVLTGPAEATALGNIAVQIHTHTTK